MPLPQTLIDQVRSEKVEYDTLSRAIKRAKIMGLDQGSIDLMITEKNVKKGLYSATIDKLQKKMPVNKNVQPLWDDWYVVRFADGGNKHVKLEPLIESEIFLIQRDCKGGVEMQRTELDGLLPAVIDYRALDHYNVHIQQEADRLLLDKFGISEDTVDVLDPSVRRPVGISNHAGIRWVQRIHKLHTHNDALAETYRKQNSIRIQEEILGGFDTADPIWTNADGSEFYLDPDNIVYLLGTDNTIVTIYEEDFGFDKSINRTITLAQLEILGAMGRDLAQKERETKEATESLSAVLYGIKDKLRILYAEIEELEAKERTVKAQKEEHSKSLTAQTTRFIGEYNKLFKRFEV